MAPAAVESVILQNSAVADCAVVGAPDDIAGELPTAFVVLKPGVHITEQELLEFINAKVFVRKTQPVLIAYDKDRRRIVIRQCDGQDEDSMYIGFS